MNVFDSSALLAFLQDEPGATVVEDELAHGGACGASNWSEVAQKILGRNRDWELAKSLLLSYSLAIEPVTAQDAEWAAHRRMAGEGLSLGDRLCLALGDRLDATIWTADRSWTSGSRIRQIH